ncbi:DUF4411 family protein [Lamprobacter modestohalophilus]|uniref:DUF4411 family protein n=1 Tax=Lamprobacter modestohalophilus TaxID=1064514 RepID=UPI002ADEAB82|nr:DUF4411 family protein [Lamprobacter modestohalophilus]MEA1048990.1 DUF4411 family protein [Lamprobacter modestohalophilus]
MTYRYLLDANSYIAAKNVHYRMHIVPGFWDWLDAQAENGQVASIEMVRAELLSYGDTLTDWVKRRDAHFLAIDDAATQQHFADIANYVQGIPSYAEPNRNLFLSGADPWLIAKAKVLDATVVTHETLVGPNSKKVKIPNVCRHFETRCCDIYDLLDRLSARFVLET